MLQALLTLPAGVSAGDPRPWRYPDRGETAITRCCGPGPVTFCAVPTYVVSDGDGTPPRERTDPLASLASSGSNVVARTARHILTLFAR
jgi:hypothetical protein